jgi:hypothetical protein
MNEFGTMATMMVGSAVVFDVAAVAQIIVDFVVAADDEVKISKEPMNSRGSDCMNRIASKQHCFFAFLLRCSVSATAATATTPMINQYTVIQLSGSALFHSLIYFPVGLW